MCYWGVLHLLRPIKYIMFIKKKKKVYNKNIIFIKKKVM